MERKPVDTLGTQTGGHTWNAHQWSYMETTLVATHGTHTGSHMERIPVVTHGTHTIGHAWECTCRNDTRFVSWEA